MADRVFPALGEYINQNRFQSDLAGELEDLGDFFLLLFRDIYSCHTSPPPPPGKTFEKNKTKSEGIMGGKGG